MQLNLDCVLKMLFIRHDCENSSILISTTSNNIIDLKDISHE